MKITVIFDNYPYEEGLATDWGFSCLIQGAEKTILFDTGADGDILLSNMKKLGIEPKIVDTVFLSHEHWDHTGGLNAFLCGNPDCFIYLLESFSTSFEAKNYKKVNESMEICENIYSTGELGNQIKEQSLILKTDKGLVIITGCAHSGIINIIKKAKELFKQEIYLVMGGFHLAELSDAEIQEIINDFKCLGVKLVSPSHCSGDRTIELFHQCYGKDFIKLGVGKVIEITSSMTKCNALI